LLGEENGIKFKYIMHASGYDKKKFDSVLSIFVTGRRRLSQGWEIELVGNGLRAIGADNF
jgi:hypothetical protein